MGGCGAYVSGGWVGGCGAYVSGGWSNLILDPTLALIRAQLGFRIQVGAECGNTLFYHKELLAYSFLRHFHSHSIHPP